MNKDGKYLITGGTGYLGRALVKKLVGEGYGNIIVLARHEADLMTLKEEYPAITIMPGDIADHYVCRKACQGESLICLGHEQCLLEYRHPAQPG